MSANLVDLMFLVMFCGTMIAVAGIGVFALPWKDDELDAAIRGFRDSGRWLERRLQRMGEVPVRRRLALRFAKVAEVEATGAFDRPSAHRAA